MQMNGEKKKKTNKHQKVEFPQVGVLELTVRRKKSMIDDDLHGPSLGIQLALHVSIATVLWHHM